MTSDVRRLPAGFGQLWAAQTVSSLGDGVSHAALPLLALMLTRDPMAFAVMSSETAPGSRADDGGRTSYVSG